MDLADTRAVRYGLHSGLIHSGLILATLLGGASAAHADCVDGGPLNIGHRGTGGSSGGNPFPENTLPSLVAAGEEGAVMVEFDVQMSADGVLVLMHDARVDATTDGRGCVSELTLDELKMLDAAAGTPMEGMGVEIPTLEEVLEGMDLGLNVELKVPSAACPAVDPEVYITELLDVLAGDPLDRVQTVSSFELDLLQELRAQEPDIYIGLLSIVPTLTEVAATEGFDALNLSDPSVTEETVMAAHDAGLELNVWTINDAERMAALIDFDADGVITDEPDVMSEVLLQECGGGETGGSGESGGSDDGATGDSDGAVDESGGADETATSAADGTGDDDGPTGGATQDDDDDDSGCSCRSEGPPAPLSMFAVVLAFLGYRRRATPVG